MGYNSIDKNELEFIMVDYGIASILLFRINILLSSKSIQFSVKIFKIELDKKVELQDILRLMYLSVGQYLSSRKVLKIFIICNNVNKKEQILKIVVPNLKASKIAKIFLS